MRKLIIIIIIVMSCIMGAYADDYILRDMYNAENYGTTTDNGEIICDGSSYLRIPDFNISDYDIKSINLWVKFNDNATGTQRIISNEISSGIGDMVLTYSGNTQELIYTTYNGTVNNNFFYAVEYDRWYMITIIFSKSTNTKELYIDSLPVARSDINMDTYIGTDYLDICKNGAGEFNYFNGNIKQISIYDKRINHHAANHENRNAINSNNEFINHGYPSLRHNILVSLNGNRQNENQTLYLDANIFGTTIDRFGYLWEDDRIPNPYDRYMFRQKYTIVNNGTTTIENEIVFNNSFIDILDVNLTQYTSKTVNLWLSLNGYNANQRIISDEKSANHGNFYLIYQGNLNRLRFHTRDSAGEKILNVDGLNHNELYMVTLIHSDNNQYIYVNGQHIGNRTTGNLIGGTSHTRLGRRADSVHNYFNGTIKQLTIYNRSLSADEILAEYNTAFTIENNIKYNNFPHIRDNSLILSMNARLNKIKNDIIVNYIDNNNFIYDIANNSIEWTDDAVAKNMKNIYMGKIEDSFPLKIINPRFTTNYVGQTFTNDNYSINVSYNFNSVSENYISLTFDLTNLDVRRWSGIGFYYMDSNPDKRIETSMYSSYRNYTMNNNFKFQEKYETTTNDFYMYNTSSNGWNYAYIDFNLFSKSDLLHENLNKYDFRNLRNMTLRIFTKNDEYPTGNFIIENITFVDLSKGDANPDRISHAKFVRNLRMNEGITHMVYAYHNNESRYYSDNYTKELIFAMIDFMIQHQKPMGAWTETYVTEHGNWISALPTLAFTNIALYSAVSEFFSDEKMQENVTLVYGNKIQTKKRIEFLEEVFRRNSEMAMSDYITDRNLFRQFFNQELCGFTAPIIYYNLFGGDNHKQDYISRMEWIINNSFHHKFSFGIERPTELVIGYDTGYFDTQLECLAWNYHLHPLPQHKIIGDMLETPMFDLVDKNSNRWFLPNSSRNINITWREYRNTDKMSNMIYWVSDELNLSKLQKIFYNRGDNLGSYGTHDIGNSLSEFRAVFILDMIKREPKSKPKPDIKFPAENECFYYTLIPTDDYYGSSTINPQLRRILHQTQDTNYYNEKSCVGYINSRPPQHFPKTIFIQNGNMIQLARSDVKINQDIRLYTQ